MIFENFGDVFGTEVSLAIQGFKMVFLRQRCVLRNFEPIYGNGNSTFSMTVHLRGFMVAISVRVPVAQWKRRYTVSDYP